MEERSGPRISGIRVIEKNDVDEALRRESGELIVVGDQAMPNGTPMPQKEAVVTTTQQVPEVKQKLPPMTKGEILCEMICLGILIYTWAHFMLEFGKLNHRVPSFGLDGQSDNVDKDQYVLIVLIDTVTYLFMSVLQFFTHKFRYLVEVTPQNAQSIFWTARAFILYFKLVTLIVLLYGTIALFKIVNREWGKEMMYVDIIFLIFYFIGGYIFHKRLKHVSIHPVN